MQTIESWIAGNYDYSEGLTLYRKHGSNKILLSLLERGETAFNRQKLITELSKLRTVAPEALPINELPTDFVELEAKTKKLYGEMAYKKSQLHTIKDPEQRRDICLEIIDTFYDHLHPDFEKLDYFRRHGRFPEEPLKIEVSITDPVMLINRRNALRSYISKAKAGKLGRDNMHVWEEELRQIQNKLASL